MNNKEKIKEWIKNHRKELLIAGVSISGLLLLIVSVRNKNDLEKLFANIKSAVMGTKTKSHEHIVEEELVNNIIPITHYLENKKTPHHVEGHLMKLAKGKSISNEMARFVEENNIELPANYTYRRSYNTGKAV